VRLSFYGTMVTMLLAAGGCAPLPPVPTITPAASSTPLPTVTATPSATAVPSPTLTPNAIQSTTIETSFATFEVADARVMAVLCFSPIACMEAPGSAVFLVVAFNCLAIKGDESVSDAFYSDEVLQQIAVTTDTSAAIPAQWIGYNFYGGYYLYFTVPAEAQTYTLHWEGNAPIVLTISSE
jgi:hypothetical protein